MPAKDQATVTAWAGAIASSGVKGAFDASGRTPSEKSVREYLAFGADNSTSITVRADTSRSRVVPAQRLASNRLTQFNEARIEDIFQSGLHEYIQNFLNENNALAGAIHEQYLV